ncbi:formin-like protein 3 isoform X2 [Iris pallida]|uniref:Formin-like protein 3 isoform X2 n=1 Tax=Iris pallida TaxID=29817 RepID=A0AAX6F5X7_IRIPA|nr:formin-like protein 3 isoform X2 [Iris pallida]
MPLYEAASVTEALGWRRDRGRGGWLLVGWVQRLVQAPRSVVRKNEWREHTHGGLTPRIWAVSAEMAGTSDGRESCESPTPVGADCWLRQWRPQQLSGNISVKRYGGRAVVVPCAASGALDRVVGRGLDHGAVITGEVVAGGGHYMTGWLG